jgi:tetratricopeptide (TPR) repeat protein
MRTALGLGATVALGLLLLAAGGCVQHASPEAMKLLAEGRDAYERSADQTVIAKTSEFLAHNAQTAEADVAYYLRGLAYYRTKDLPAAREDLKRSAAGAQQKDLHMKVIKALGDLAFDTGDADWAETLYREALDEMDLKAPPADEIRYRLGCVLQLKGNWWDADSQFGRLGHDFPDSPPARLGERRTRCRAWTFQIAAFDRKDLADSESARLAKVGLATAVHPAVVEGKLRFMVQAGRYDTYAGADDDAPAIRNAAANAQLVPTR